MLMLTDMIEVARGDADPEAARAKSPRRFGASDAPVVVWNVCRHCNMTCPHCYVAAGARPSRADLSTADALRVIDDLASSGVRTVIVSGGEPLLRSDVFALLARMKAVGIGAQLSTNGVLVDPKTAHQLRELGVQYVGVSLDGQRSFNDAYRGLEGGFDAALEGLRNARAAGMRTGVRMTLTRRNFSAVEEVAEVAHDVGAGRFYLSHLVYAGRGLRMVGDDLSPAESRAALLALFDLADRWSRERRPMRFVTGSNDSDGPLLCVWLRERFGAAAAARAEALLRARGGNSAGEKVVCIDHRGRVHPDQFWQDAVFGVLPKQRFADVLAHPLRAELRAREESLGGRCGACAFRAMCRGSHRERALATTGDAWAPDPACVMTDEEVLGKELACDVA